MTTAELLASAHRRGWRLLSEAELRTWLADLAAEGLLVELEGDAWALTDAGRAYFVRAGELAEMRE